MFNPNMYDELLELVKKHDAFFYKNFDLENKKYRIFDYELAGWQAFQEPSALNARGVMFDITDENDIKLVSLPPMKFFNYEEGTINHAKSKFGDKMVKLDGSLISTFMHNGEVYLKSKGSLFSKHAINAMNLLNANINLKEEVKKLVQEGFTVNFEYISPDFRIVVPYQKDELKVLSLRSHKTGNIYFASKMIEKLTKAGYKEILNNLVDYESLHGEKIEHDKYLEDVRNEKTGEGYVQELIDENGNSYLVKIKNLKYISLHHVKDNLNSQKRIFNVVLDGGSDDLRAMYANDEASLNKIIEMENKVQNIFNHMVKTVENFYEENKELNRKDYAIKAGETKKLQGLMMFKYLGKDMNYKEFARKNMQEIFGIKEEENAKDMHPANKNKM